MSACTRLTLVGGPTVVLRYAGLTVLTDPTFDPPGDHGGLVKTEGPALSVSAVGPVDLALVSHDHHPDNLDDAGRALLAEVPTVLSTTAAATRVPGVTGLAPGESVTVDGGEAVSVTAVPALHGPPGVAEHTGPVVGFVLRAAGWPTVYFSGDNSEPEVARGIARDFPDVTVAVLCAGAARVANRGPDPLTLDAERVLEVAAAWPGARIVPVHMDQWEHFSEPRAVLLPLLREALGTRLVTLHPGEQVTLAT